MGVAEAGFHQTASNGLFARRPKKTTRLLNLVREAVLVARGLDAAMLKR